MCKRARSRCLPCALDVCLCVGEGLRAGGSSWPRNLTCGCVAVTGWEQGAIKVADIGHLYAPKEVHIKWSERLEEEMWLQGDVEKQRDMKVLTLMPAACWRVAASPLPGAACAALSAACLAHVPAASRRA